MIRKIAIGAALLAAFAVSVPSSAQAYGPRDVERATEVFARARENMRLSAERDFYDRVSDVDQRSAAAGLLTMPAQRNIRPPEATPAARSEDQFRSSRMSRAMKAVRSQPLMVLPWFFDCFNGVGVSLRARL